MKKLPYIAIVLLLLIILLQNRGCNEQNNQEVRGNTLSVDTIYITKHVIDTITVEKPVIIFSKPDIIWMKKEENTPDSTYNGLLYQYKQLGDRYFTTNVFQNKFDIEDYGSVTVTDTIYGNWLMSSTIFTDLDIQYPEITIERTNPPKTQLYIGPSFTGNKINPLSGIYGDVLLKTKKDRMYRTSIGWNGENTTFGFGMYFKIRIK